MQGRQVKLYLMGLGPQEAFEAVSKVIGLQFQGYFLDKIVGEFCDVSKNKFPAEIEFNCDGGNLSPQNTAWIAIAQGYYRLINEILSVN